jgi:hypothetical protein
MEDMKIRAKANGDILETDDAAAKELIDAGIYEAVATRGATPKSPAKTPPPPAPAAPPPKAPAPGTSTKVAPMTTEDMPSAPAKKVK